MSRVRVIARIRPDSVGSSIFGFLSKQSLTIENQKFTFDSVYGPETTQAQLFNNDLEECVAHTLKGFDGAIIAYGQTASGKTHTMMGSSGMEKEGVIPRAIRYILDCQQDPLNPGLDRPEISMTYVEIYMDRVFDLFNNRNTLSLLNDGSPAGACTIITNSAESSLQAVSNATKLRSTAATKMNEGSSRSHSVLTVILENGARLMLVDLAGSEGAKKSGATGITLKEAGEINNSLSSLAQVVSLLTSSEASGGERHIPFRNSKLTHYLKRAFGTNSKTLIIINCSSSPAHAAESLNSMRFGVRAKQITIKMAVQNPDYGFWRDWNSQLAKIQRKWDIFGPPSLRELPDFRPLLRRLRKKNVGLNTSWQFAEELTEVSLYTDSDPPSSDFYQTKMQEIQSHELSLGAKRETLGQLEVEQADLRSQVQTRKNAVHGERPTNNHEADETAAVRRHSQFSNFILFMRQKLLKAEKAVERCGTEEEVEALRQVGTLALSYESLSNAINQF